jgi:hypothetical protein
MLVASLSSFFLGWLFIGFHGIDTIGSEDSGRAMGFLILLVVSLFLSWLAFVYSIRNFRYYDDKRWAWFYALLSDLIATMFTVVALYSIFSMITSVSSF